MVICLERGADLHMAQLMPLPLTVSCFSKIQIGLPFWYRLTWVFPEKGPLNGCVYMYHKNSIIIHTIFTIITSLKVGVHIIHVNWSACQFPRSNKWDWSSTWRSANSIRSVVGFCSCCLMLTACTRQVSTATWRSRHWCDSQLLSPSLPPFAGESNYRKRLYAQGAQQR